MKNSHFWLKYRCLVFAGEGIRYFNMRPGTINRPFKCPLGQQDNTSIKRPLRACGGPVDSPSVNSFLAPNSMDLAVFPSNYKPAPRNYKPWLHRASTHEPPNFSSLINEKIDIQMLLYLLTIYSILRFLLIIRFTKPVCLFFLVYLSIYEHANDSVTVKCTKKT